VPPVIFSWSLFGVLCLSAIANHLRGPSCACRLQTAVGAEQLYAVNRLRTAARVLARIRPLIESAQGPFNPDELPESPAVLASPVAQPPPVPMVRMPKHCRGRAHWALTGLLALDLLACLADLYKPMTGAVETAYGFLMLFGMFGVLIAALVTQAHSDLPNRLKRLTYVTAGFILFALIAFSVIPMIWNHVQQDELRFWGNIYSVLGETVLCLAFWRGLRGWR